MGGTVALGYDKVLTVFVSVSSGEDRSVSLQPHISSRHSVTSDASILQHKHMPPYTLASLAVSGPSVRAVELCWVRLLCSCGRWFARKETMSATHRVGTEGALSQSRTHDLLNVNPWVYRYCMLFCKVVHLRDKTPCSFQHIYQSLEGKSAFRLTMYPEDGGHRFMRNCSKICTAPRSRRV
jgi:hypothetical protein